MSLRNTILIGTPALALALGLGLIGTGVTPIIAWTVAITLLAAVWWVSEALPIPVTSLLPFCLFPLFGVLDAKQAASGLGANVILLLMGAFMLSKAIERSGLHRRFALMMIQLIGGPALRFAEWRLVLAFMITAALLSMWISNSATTLMLTPIALAVLQDIEQPRLTRAVLLGVAYAASVGGTATLVGTPPNVIFAGVYEQFTGAEYGFLRWMKTGVPIMMLSIPLMALWLARGLRAQRSVALPALGPWRAEEKRVLMVFGLTVFLWVFRAEPFGGWSGWLDIDGISDASIALFAVVLMCLVPNGKGSGLLDWESAGNIPWGMLLLFAGGIVIAKAFSASGLSQVIGNGLGGLAGLPVLLMLLVITLSVSFLTEITSNTATATLLMPVLAAAAMGAAMAPELLMLPAAVAASSAFMLPVATAPNAIVYATDRLSIREMAREGVVLNIIVALVVTAVCALSLG